MKSSFLVCAITFFFSAVTCSHCQLTPPDDTHTDMLGPYYVKDTNYKGTVLVPSQRTGASEKRIVVSGFIMDSSCNHIPCAEIEVWGTDPFGEYSFRAPFWGRGRIKADENGYYEFETWYPAYYTTIRRPQHIHYLVTPPGGNSFITQLYFSNDPVAAGMPSTVKAMPELAGTSSVDFKATFNLVLPGKTVVKSGTCPADTGKSVATSGAMSQFQILSQRGSTVGLNMQAVVKYVTSSTTPTASPATTTTSATATTSIEVPVPPTPLPCSGLVDSSTLCHQKYCVSSLYRAWADRSCPLTCCNLRASDPAECPTIVQDANPQCKTWAQNFCSSPQYAPWMHQNCAASCCAVASRVSQCSGLTNNRSRCSQPNFAQYCRSQMYQEWMQSNCALLCCQAKQQL